MTLGIAVFVLGCFWFYFKEPGFRKAVHIGGAVLGVLVLLGSLSAGAWYLKSQHDEKTKAAQEQARTTQVQGCVERGKPLNPTGDGLWNGAAIESACEKDSNADLSKVVITWDESTCPSELTAPDGTILFIPEVSCHHASRPATFAEIQAEPSWRKKYLGPWLCYGKPLDGQPSTYCTDKTTKTRPTFPQSE